MPLKARVCAGFRSASRVVSESGREESATAAASAADASGNGPLEAKAIIPKAREQAAKATAMIFIGVLCKHRPFVRWANLVLMTPPIIFMVSNLLIMQALGELSDYRYLRFERMEANSTV